MNNKKISRNKAIACLISNIIIPGLGSLIGKRTKEGIWQFLLLFGAPILGFLIGLIFIGSYLETIGTLLMVIGPFSAYIWGIKTGINLINESE